MSLDPRRIGRITGSRIAAILGLNPYSSRADVLREMVREALGAPREFTGNDATRYGQEMEPLVLAAYERHAGTMVHGGQEFVIHPIHHFLAATPDGLVGDDGTVECKAPYRGTYTHFDEVPYYVPQMRLQMACTGRQWCDLAVLHRDGSLHVSRLEHDPEWLPHVLPTLKAFMADFAEAIADPAQHLTERERDDDEWHTAVAEYRIAKIALDNAQAALDARKATLIEMAGEAGAKGAGLQVIRCERAGSVSYAKAIKDLLPDADLSEYAGKPTTYYTIKETP